MPLSFQNFKEEGLFGLSDSQKIWPFQDKSEIRQEEKQHLCTNVVRSVLPEPTSVLDALRSPSPLTASSSHITTVNTGDYKCNQMGFDDLHSVVLSGQQQRLIMDQSSGFSDFDPSFGFRPVPVSDNSNPFCTFPNPEALCLSPPTKRFNSGFNQPDLPFSDLDQFQFHHQQLQIPSLGMAGDDESVITEQLFNAAELIETTGNNKSGDYSVLAQGILARLNHYLNSSNNNLKSPFLKAVSHISQVLLSFINNNNDSSPPPENNLILKIAAYKSFSESSPCLQFVNFTSNQLILDSYNESGFDRIHIIDFDVGFGGQWPSLMQELVNGKRRNRASSLKLTVFTPPPSTISDEFELRFTEQNLKTFAGEIKLPFEIEFVSIGLLLNALSHQEKEAIAVNLPISSVIFSGYLPLILRFLKEIKPNVVVCSDTSLDRNDAPFPNFVIHALQYQTNLLESLDSNQHDSISVEKFWVQPLIEKVLMKRHRWIERTLPWRSLFTQCGFSPVSLSQNAVVQAECLVQRWLVRGFRVEKRQSSSLVLCWLRNELVTVSAWKC